MSIGRLSCFLSVGATVMGCVSVSTIQAQVAVANPKSPTQLVSSGSTCVDVSGASQAAGAAVLGWPCNGQSNELWTFTTVNTNTYLISSVNSNKCLDVSGASSANGAPVLQWPCGSGKQNQQWQLYPSGTSYQLMSINSGKCLVAPGGGGQLQQTACNANVAGQLWSIPSVSATIPASPLVTTTTASVTPISALLGKAITVSVQVGTSSSIPSGAVNIYDGSNLLSTVAIGTSGQVSYSISGLSVGSHNIYASFTGGSAFAPSTSGATTVTVAQSSTGEQASQSDAFVDSIGIQTHLTYTDTPYFTNFPKLLSELKTLGIRHVRDGFYNWAASSPIVAAHQALANAGIKTTYVFPLDPSVVTVPNIVALSGLTGDLEALEPTNECDAGTNCGGGGLVGINNVLAELPTLKNAGAVLGVPVLGPSYTIGPAYSQSGNISSSISYNNLHVYYGGRFPGSGGWGDGDAQGHAYGSLAWWMDQGNLDAPGVPDIITETGYMSLQSPTPYTVSEGVEATYTPRTLLLAYNKGVKRTFIYQLLEDNSLATGYGILRPDVSEKPVFTALKNLTTLLGDQGQAFSPGSLNYSITGTDSTLQHTLLQKRDGSFWLALWLEQSSYNIYTNTDTPVSAQTAVLTVNGGEAAQNIYTFDRTGAVSVSALATSSNAITLPVTDQLTFVQIAPR